MNYATTENGIHENIYFYLNESYDVERYRGPLR